MAEVSVQDQLKKVLAEYAEEVDETCEDVMEKVAKETATDLQGTSPRRSGEYARGWKTKKMGKLDHIVYNATKPQLTHLLNNGHVIRNKKGTYGRVNGDGHIATAEANASQKIIEELRHKL